MENYKREAGYRKLRIAGLERAIDEEINPEVKETMLMYLRQEKDAEADYETFGVYEED